MKVGLKKSKNTNLKKMTKTTSEDNHIKLPRKLNLIFISFVFYVEIILVKL
jgi:hypothetical protein